MDSEADFMGNTCVVLIDVWKLSSKDITQLGEVYQAWLHAYIHIEELLTSATRKRIPIYFENNNHKAPLIIQRALTSASLIKGFRNYKNLIYAGFALDQCVASRGDYGYTKVDSSYNKYIIKDAGLVQHVLYHGKDRKLWPEYSKIMKARSPNKPLPWKTSQDLIDESILFCDNYASRFCTSLYLKDLKNEDMFC